MAAGNEAANFQINMAGNAADVAKTTSSAMSDLKKRIDEQRGSLKELQSAYKGLTGSTDEVKRAKADLKTQIDAAKGAIKAQSAELKSQKAAYKTSSEGAKKLKEDTKKLAEEIKKKKAIAEKIEANKVAREASDLEMLTGVYTGLVTVLAAVAVGFISAGIAAAKFVLRGADAARSVGLLREAAMGGNAAWGKNFGEQVDALARKVPTSKAEIDKLGMSLAKSRIGGQVWVDTLNAVTQASAALGDDAGAKIKEFVERGRLMGRMQINPQEMIGTGVDFKDVAEALSTSMKIGVKDAQQALFEGRVKLADGAAALRLAVEKKVGGVNLRQMLSLDNLLKKLGESFDELTKGIDLEPMLKGFKEIANIFSITTTSGQALKQIVEVFGKELAGSFTSTTPLAKKLVYGIILGAQEIVIAYLKVKNALKETFGDVEVAKNLEVMKVALVAGKIAAYGMGAAVLMTAGFIAAAAAPFIILGVAIGTIVYSGVQLVKTIFSIGAILRDTDWKALGGSIVDGLINGLSEKAGALSAAVKGLGARIKNAFTGELEIRSPSKAFFRYGENIDEGAAQGVEANGRAESAVQSMVSVPAGGGAGGSRAGGAPVTVNVTINASGANGKEVADAITSESVIEQLSRIILNAVQGGGVPVPS
jgi:hypothetical protein